MSANDTQDDIDTITAGLEKCTPDERCYCMKAIQSLRSMLPATSDDVVQVIAPPGGPMVIIMGD